MIRDGLFRSSLIPLFLICIIRLWKASTWRSEVTPYPRDDKWRLLLVKFVRLEVTSYETGEVTNGKAKIENKQR